MVNYHLPIKLAYREKLVGRELEEYKKKREVYLFIGDFVLFITSFCFVLFCFVLFCFLFYFILFYFI